jgi:hypothetical protein
MAHLVSRCRVGPGRGNLDHTLQFFVQTSGPYENVTRFAKFIHPLNVGLQFFFSFDTFSARPVLASNSKQTGCQINVFVGVWPSSARAWLRGAHWKERARIDAAPCPERKAFDTEEWLRERTELLRRGKARSHAVASPSIACLIWFQVESDESRGRFPSSVARHRRPLEVEHHGVLGVQRSEPGAGRRATPFPRTRTPRALPTRAVPRGGAKFNFNSPQLRRSTA